MRRDARTDDNQAEIVKALRQIPGCSVVSLAAVGEGMSDLIVGYRGVNLLIECKDGNKPPSAQKLTPAQVKFHNEWRGQVATVNSVDAAIDLVLQGWNTRHDS